MDIASSIQEATEEIVMRLGRTVHRELAVDYLCLAGGVALNCVANKRLLREGPFKDICQPAAGGAWRTAKLPAQQLDRYPPVRWATTLHKISHLEQAFP